MDTIKSLREQISEMNKEYEDLRQSYLVYRSRAKTERYINDRLRDEQRRENAKLIWSNQAVDNLSTLISDPFLICPRCAAIDTTSGVHTKLGARLCAQCQHTLPDPWATDKGASK
jgi:regulator of replication initiation timing